MLPLPDLAGSTRPGDRHRPLIAPPAERPQQLAAAPVLVLDRVSKWYGPVLGLNQASLELRPGLTGLVGGNGAGKSTLLRLAAGLLRPDLGSVRVAGHHAWNAEAKRHIGYCPDTDAFYEDLTAWRFVLEMALLCGYSRTEARQRAAAVLERVGMAGRADRPMRCFSKGMRQRIKLAQALLHEPALLLLDEPLSGIDPIGRQELVHLFRELAEEGRCLLISSHELDELEKLTDQVAIMARGRIAAVGTVTAIRDLLDEHPLSIQLACAEARRLASDLVQLPDVVAAELTGGDGLRVQARNPRGFFQQLMRLVLEEKHEVTHIETLDDSTQAILTYLLGGRR